MTTVELVRRGYGFTESKRMVKTSDLLPLIKQCDAMAMDTDGIKEWADLVLDFHAHKTNLDKTIIRHTKRPLIIKKPQKTPISA